MPNTAARTVRIKYQSTGTKYTCNLGGLTQPKATSRRRRNQVFAPRNLRTLPHGVRMDAPSGIAVSATDVAYSASRNSSDSGSRRVLLRQKTPGAVLSTTTNISGGPRHRRDSANSKNYIENLSTACTPPQRARPTAPSTANSSGGAPYYQDTADSEGLFEVLDMNRRFALKSARCVAEYVGQESIRCHTTHRTSVSSPLFDSAVPNVINGNYFLAVNLPNISPKQIQSANPPDPP